jgi:hypothetical protein
LDHGMHARCGCHNPVGQKLGDCKIKTKINRARDANSLGQSFAIMACP